MDISKGWAHKHCSINGVRAVQEPWRDHHPRSSRSAPRRRPNRCTATAAGGLCASRLQHAAGARSAAKQVRDPENDQSAAKKVKREIKQEITTTTTIKQEPLSSQISKLFDAGGSFKQEKDEDEDDDWETTQVGPEIKEEDEEFDWLGPAANATEEAVETEKTIMRIGRFSGC